DRQAAIARAADLVRRTRRNVILSGAGLSTESGIPDFRSPGGVWERFRPIEYQDFLDHHPARVEHWRYKRETIPPMLQAEPNRAHQVIAELEAAGRVSVVITQNIDSLHQKAGTQRILELHGTNAEAVCLGCRERTPIEDALAQLETGIEVPQCPSCDGILKPATISFGQPLPQRVLHAALEAASGCECFLVLGSSLQVQPAASLAGVAKQYGAQLIIINLTPTPYDGIADVVIHAKLCETMAEIARLNGQVTLT
ncbi:MAG TPA: NAD-dependent protein deacylase, partial [Terriglobales bacterium]|nr:NAD-dependent protein deacylase [Terriglobales bacterium]